MSDLETLYEVLGELLYAVAMADGVIQKEENQAMENLLKNHPWGEEINWSFTHKRDEHISVDEAYDKAINYCKYHGPSAYYEEFISAMKEIAAAADGVHENETRVIECFSKDLIEKFQHDIDLGRKS